MNLHTFASRLTAHTGTFVDVARSGNLKVVSGLLGPAVRGFVLRRGSQPSTEVECRHDAHFDWRYQRDRQELARLYAQAKTHQWDGATDLQWQTDVDPLDPEVPLLQDGMFPLAGYDPFERLPPKQQLQQRHAMAAWLLSQFLHGEQGALFAACQVTQAVGWMDGKLYGATQVVDEGRHVEVFHRYLTDKLGKLYDIDENLYVVIDSLMQDPRWDMKFLGMQILIEGLALGAFGTLRQSTREPLLRKLLEAVMLDEARHVAFGVLALRDHYTTNLSPAEREEREDWAFEMAVLLRNRFLAHEFYEEHWAHAMSRRQWDELVLKSPFMQTFRRRMFRRIIPNLKRIGLLSDRIRPRYAQLGVLEWEHDKAAPELTGVELMDD